MAVVKNLVVRAGADFSALTKAVKKAQSGMSGMQKSVSSACSRMSSAVSGVGKMFSRMTAAISVAAVAAAAKAAKDAYDTQIESETKLATVMKQRMAATDAQIQSVLDLTSAQQRLGVVGDEVQLAGAQQIATFLSETDSLNTLIPAMNDLLAQQKGLSATTQDAVTVGNLMGKVLQGQTSALRRVGITFTAAQEAVLKYGTEQERAAMLAQVITDNVGHMNAALAATPSGRLQQVKNTLGDIKESFGAAVTQVLTVFMPVLNTAASLLATVATLANKAAQAIANVFGADIGMNRAVSYTAAAAEGLDDLAESAEGAGSAAKEAENQLLGFDKITKLSDHSSSASGAASGGASASAVGVGSFAEAAEDTQAAGESIGWLEKVLGRLKATVESLDFSRLSDSFARLRSSVEPITQGLFSGLKWAYDNVLEPLVHWTVEDAVPAFLDTLADSAAACAEPLKNLGAAAAPLVSSLFEGLKWAYDNVFIPFASWAGGELLPAFLDTLADAASFLSSVLDALRPLGQWLWDNFLAPIASWTGGVIVDTLTLIGNGLRVVGDWIRGHQTAVEAIAIAVGSFAAAMTLVNTAIGLWNAVGAIASAVTAAFGVAVNALTSPITLVVAAIAALIAIVVLLVKHWDEVKAAALKVWEKIKEIWGAVAGWFDSTVIQPVKVAFTMVASAVKKTFTDAWNGIKSVWATVAGWFQSKVLDPVKNAFRGAINGVLGFFEGLANGAIRGVNAIIRALNKISFDIPDWVPVIGGGKFGFNISEIGQISLPRLAEGAVLRGNDPFLAVVNEQKHGVNVETPLKTMLEAFRTALREEGLADRRSAGPLTIPIYVGGRKITQFVIDDINDISRTTGVCPINI